MPDEIKQLQAKLSLTLMASLRGPRLGPLTPEEEADKLYWDERIAKAEAELEAAVSVTWGDAHP